MSHTNNTNDTDIEHQQASLNAFLNSFDGDSRFEVERIINDRTITVGRILALSDSDELVQLHLENVGEEEAVKKCQVALMFARELRAASSLALPLEIAQRNAADASTTDSSIRMTSIDNSGDTSNVAMESVAQGNSIAESMETSNTMSTGSAGH